MFAEPVVHDPAKHVALIELLVCGLSLGGCLWRYAAPIAWILIDLYNLIAILIGFLK